MGQAVRSERTSYLSPMLIATFAPSETTTRFAERIAAAEETIAALPDTQVWCGVDGQRLPFPSVAGFRFWPHEQIGNVVTCSQSTAGHVFCETVRHSATSFLVGRLRDTDVGERTDIGNGLSARVSLSGATALVTVGLQLDGIELVPHRLGDLPLQQ